MWKKLEWIKAWKLWWTLPPGACSNYGLEPYWRFVFKAAPLVWALAQRSGGPEDHQGDLASGREVTGEFTGCENEPNAVAGLLQEGVGASLSSRVLSVAHRRPCFACDQSPHLELFKVPGRLSYKDRQADSRERGGRRKESSQQASYKGTSTKEGCQQAGIPSRAGWWSRSRAGTCCASPGAVRRRRSRGRRGQDWPSQRSRSCTFARPPAVYHREDIGGGVGTKRRKKTSCRWLRPELPAGSGRAVATSALVAGSTLNPRKGIPFRVEALEDSRGDNTKPLGKKMKWIGRCSVTVAGSGGAIDAGCKAQEEGEGQERSA